MLPKLNFIDPTLPSSVARRLELMLYAEPLSHGLYIIGLGVVAIAVCLRTSDFGLAAGSASLFVLSILRVAIVRKYKSAPAYLPVLLAFGIVFASMLAFL